VGIPEEGLVAKKQARSRWRVLRRLRQATQYLVLGLFVYLFIRTTREGGSPIPVDLFARLDPLLALNSMLAARTAIPSFAPALITVLATLALGRIWCGWICPLGTVLDLFGTNVREAIPERLLQAKYFLLFVGVAAAVLGSLTLVWLDPITISSRALAGTIYPAVLRAMADSPGSRSLQPVVYPLLALPLVFALVMNLVVRRFWCRYLCPLGALLALLSKYSWVKRFVRDTCVSCSQCLPECPMDTISGQDFTSDPDDCIQCLNCHARCAVTSLSFKAGWNPAFGREYDPSRRQFLASLAVGAAWASLPKTGLLRANSAYLLRPPGASEADILARCVRCGECIKICPNNALRLTTFEAGLEGVATPMLVPRLGYCAYSCNACGQVCPSGAIPPLSLEEKRKAVMGTAVIDVDVCIDCRACVERCPVGAIERVHVDGKDAMFPQVASDLCIGCGICKYICPMRGDIAIGIYAPGALG